ncbi:MFS transporter [Peribacillus glennii]|nr:MFS transporter [Peribacillus glennii]
MVPEQKPSYLYILTGMLVSLVAISFARLAYGVVLPFMKEGLSISYKMAGLLGTITSLGYLVTVMFAGVVSTKWGEKRAILCGLSLITIGFLNLSYTASYIYSSIFMFLLGIGTAFTFTPLISVLIQWFPAQRGLVIGFVNSGAGIGVFITGALVPFLHSLYPETDWRITWRIFCILSVLVCLMVLLIIKNPPMKKTAATEPPVLPRQIYTDRNVIRVALIYGVVGLTYITQSIFMMSFMLDEGLKAQHAGKLIAIGGILSILSSPIWGGISDRLGRKSALLLAMAFNLLSTIAPILMPNSFGFTVNLLIQGIVNTGVFTMVQTLSTEQVHPRYATLSFSYATFYFAVGQFIGPTLAGLAIDYVGFTSIFSLSAVWMAAALYLVTKVPTKTELQTSMSIEPEKGNVNI